MFVRGYELRKSDIGGGVVRTAFRMGPRWVISGTKLSADEVMSINPSNRAALIDKGFIAVWPKSGDQPNDPNVSHETEVPRRMIRRYAIHYGAGKYDVFEGRKLNVDPLTREEASELAGGVEHR